jgi:transposase
VSVLDCAQVCSSCGVQSRRQFVGSETSNRASRVTVVVRLRHDPRRRVHVERRTREGLSKREIIRCLKGYLPREDFDTLRADLLAPHGLDGL